MTGFNFQAINLKGETISGDLQADNRSSAEAILRRRGLRITSIRRQSSGQSTAFLKRIPTLFTRINEAKIFQKPINVRDIAVFLRQLAAMVEAGLPYARIFQVLEVQTRNPTMKKNIAGIRGLIENGESLSDSFTHYPDMFSPIIINMVHAGEVGGILDQILNRLASFVEWENAIRGKIKSAMTYPLVLMCVAALVLTFMLLFILPQFVGMFVAAGVELPGPTRVLLGITHALKNYGFLILGGLVTLVLGIRYYIRTEQGGYYFDLMLIRLPVIRSLVTKVAVSRFSKTLGSLHDVGVPIIQTLDIISRTVNNRVFERALQAVSSKIADGVSIGKAFDSIRLLPEMVRQMISVGDETGELSLLVEKISTYYDQEVEEEVKRLTTILEPIMIVLMASLVGFIAISVLLPIFDMIRVVRGG